MAISVSSINRINSRWLWASACIGFYVLLEWASSFNPLFGLGITPWNLGPAFGLVCWLRYGKATAIPWFIALVVVQYLTQKLDANPVAIGLASACLTLGYGMIGEVLRRNFPRGNIFDNRESMFTWLGIVICGTLINSLIHTLLLYAIGHMPQDLLLTAFKELSVGDMVGIAVAMPFFWLMSSKEGRSELRQLIIQKETAGYIALTLIIFWLDFGLWRASESRHFYFIFVPLVWAASRQGVAGASLAVFLLQISLMLLIQEVFTASVPIIELQLLAAILGLTTFFIGVVADEHRRISEGLKHTIRLASAGEMTAAWAHELNQPMTALLAYGKAAERLLARGETGDFLKKAVQQMISEATRATDVVRRLRDFFRTGAMTIETVNLKEMVTDAMQRYLLRATAQETVMEMIDIPEISFQADKLQIEIVLHNLLVNALESVASMSADYRDIMVTAVVLPDDRLCITVEDSGPGVSLELSERLFESFFSTKPTGLGLGLVISKAIAIAHGGSLMVQPSNHGIFKLVLPISEREKDAAK